MKEKIVSWIKESREQCKLCAEIAAFVSVPYILIVFAVLQAGNAVY